jgi:hypothetical protein
VQIDSALGQDKAADLGKHFQQFGAVQVRWQRKSAGFIRVCFRKGKQTAGGICISKSKSIVYVGNLCFRTTAAE